MFTKVLTEFRGIFLSPKSNQQNKTKQNKQKKATPFKIYLLPAHTKGKIPVLFKYLF